MNHLHRRPQALLLDAGDTLIFFDASALAGVLFEHGFDASAARLQDALHPAKRRYQAHLARGNNHMDSWSLFMCDLLEIAGLERAAAERALPALRLAHAEHNFWRRVPEGLVAALARAKAGGIRLGVISNSEGKLLSILERVELTSHFETILDSQLEGVHKPDPEIFRRALARMDVTADRAIYAGDVPEVDVLGARAAGMHAVLIDEPGHFGDDTRWPRVSSVEQLVERLLALP